MKTINLLDAPNVLQNSFPPNNFYVMKGLSIGGSPKFQLACKNAMINRVEKRRKKNKLRFQQEGGHCRKKW